MAGVMVIVAMELYHCLHSLEGTLIDGLSTVSTTSHIGCVAMYCYILVIIK